jgi:hypothetical protein
MLKGKGHYLKELTSQTHIRSVEVGKQLEGASPPSVFIGSWNYPKVWAGPMIAPYHGDTAIMDSPEEWIQGGFSQRQIIDFRLNLVRGKHPVRVTDTDEPLIEKLRDITLAKGSVETETTFIDEPTGMGLSDEHTPYGPSGIIDEFEVDAQRWETPMERVYYDGDLKAKDAVMGLYEGGMNFSRIQKALSVGAMGEKRKRRLVPTRWSITACDTTLANQLLDDVRHHDILDTHKVYEFDSLNNHYAVILTPTAWQYEWTEAFLHIIGEEELVFSDHETNLGKRGYSSVGGCYYSCKFAVLEALQRMKIQAGAIVLREAYRGYVPLGVFNVRENVRAAMRQAPRDFDSLKDALRHVGLRMRLPMDRYIRETQLLRELSRNTQMRMTGYLS